MLCGKLAALILLAISTILNVYKAGKYANGGVDINKGVSAAIGSLIGALIGAIIFIALYLEI